MNPPSRLETDAENKESKPHVFIKLHDFSFKFHHIEVNIFSLKQQLLVRLLIIAVSPTHTRIPAGTCTWMSSAC